MIEELKPCPEMIEKVARAIGEAERASCGGYQSTTDSDPKWNPWLTDKHRMFARAAITAIDPDKRLRKAALREAADWLRRNFASLGETNLFCATNAMLNELGVDEDIGDALKLRAELGLDAALSHKGV